MTQKVDLSKAKAKIEAKLKQITDTNILKTLGTEAIRLIKERTRQGLGVKENFGNTTKLARLSDEYIEQRKRMRLSPFTTPTTSNLTLSGRLLASLRVTTKNKAVEIAPTGTNRNGVSNQDIANFQAEAKKPRIFLNLSGSEFKELILFYKRKISTLK